MTRLYSFRPNGHGQVSFFVAADSQEEAREAVLKQIALSKCESHNLDEYDVRGFDSDYYEVTESERGEVVMNYND